MHSLDVLRQIVASGEHSVAERTGELVLLAGAAGPLVERPHVVPQAAQIGVLLAARGAHVRPVLRVRLAMARDARQCRCPGDRGVRTSVMGAMETGLYDV